MSARITACIAFVLVFGCTSALSSRKLTQDSTACCATISLNTANSLLIISSVSEETCLSFVESSAGAEPIDYLYTTGEYCLISYPQTCQSIAANGIEGITGNLTVQCSAALTSEADAQFEAAAG